MKSSLKERFEQLVHIPAADRAPTGSSGVFVLRLPRPPGNGLPETIPAMTTLVHCGMVLLKAKRAIEALLESPVVIVELPTVADENMLIAELAKSGIDARSVSADLEAPSTVHERQG
jgi:hypothetical protein